MRQIFSPGVGREETELLGESISDLGPDCTHLPTHAWPTVGVRLLFVLSNCNGVHLEDAPQLIVVYKKWVFPHMLSVNQVTLTLLTVLTCLLTGKVQHTLRSCVTNANVLFLTHLCQSRLLGHIQCCVDRFSLFSQSLD